MPTSENQDREEGCACAHVCVYTHTHIYWSTQTKSKTVTGQGHHVIKQEGQLIKRLCKSQVPMHPPAEGLNNEENTGSSSALWSLSCCRPLRAHCFPQRHTMMPFLYLACIYYRFLLCGYPEVYLENPRDTAVILNSSQLNFDQI